MESTSNASLSDSVRIVNLQANNEFRFELDHSETLAIFVVKGTAEIFGSELTNGKWYLFGSELKASVFTWQGCTLNLRGSASTEYESVDTILNEIHNLNTSLEQFRLKARQSASAAASSSSSSSSFPLPSSSLPSNSSTGPTVMVLGQETCGKSTICKTLLNLATRSVIPWCPNFVNLDPSNGAVTGVPGTVSATPIPCTLPTVSPICPFGSSITSGAMSNPASQLVPVSWFFGHSEVGRNTPLFEMQMRNAASLLKKRAQDNVIRAAAGTIIDTPGCFGYPVIPGDETNKAVKYGLVSKALEIFNVDILVVVGQEKLLIEMKKIASQMPKPPIIVKIAKSGGVVDTDAAYKARVMDAQVRAYFYGLPILTSPAPGIVDTISEELSPNRLPIRWDVLSIYKVGEESIAPSSALPIGMTRVLSETQVERMDLSTTLSQSKALHSVLAIVRDPKRKNLPAGTAPPKPVPGFGRREEEEDGILESEVIGFVALKLTLTEAKSRF